jgi:hypothetical protein
MNILNSNTEISIPLIGKLLVGGIAGGTVSFLTGHSFLTGAITATIATVGMIGYQAINAQPYWLETTPLRNRIIEEPAENQPGQISFHQQLNLSVAQAALKRSIQTILTDAKSRLSQVQSFMLDQQIQKLDPLAYSNLGSLVILAMIQNHPSSDIVEKLPIAHIGNGQISLESRIDDLKVKYSAMNAGQKATLNVAIIQQNANDFANDDRVKELQKDIKELYLNITYCNRSFCNMLTGN